MPLSIDEQIEFLGTTILQARLHFDVWEALQEARGDPDAVQAMNNYREFFSSTMLAHFESFIISCYQLLETPDDRVSFPSLKRTLELEEGRDIDQEPDLVDIQVEMKPLWIRISTIRNQSVGHLSQDKSQYDVFKSAGLSAQDIEDFMSLAVELHHGITYRRDRRKTDFNIKGKQATQRLLSALKKQF